MGLTEELAAEWGLVLERPLPSQNAVVVAAGDAVLKINADWHFEAEHEADALALWAGDGAVRLLARDDERRALLLERCRPGRPLGDEPEVVAALLERLQRRVEAPHPFRLLAGEADRWAEDVPHRWELGGRPFARSLLDFAVDVFRSVDRSATWLVNQDLHGGNVLAAEREPWLVIDPKPLVGERELEGVGPLRNAAPTTVPRWLDALVALGLDRERTRGWAVAHALAWGWDEARGWDPRAVETAAQLRASA